MNNVRMTNWTIRGNVVALSYDDGTEVNVRKADFDRAFGAMLNASKEAVIRDFAIVG